MSIDLKKITEELDKASLFELYLLRAAIDDQMDDPIRLHEVKRKLRPGQEIEYFDQNENKLFRAKVVKIKRTRVVVENEDDNRLWAIPFYAVNLDNIAIEAVAKADKLGISKSQLEVGAKVGFRDNNNKEHYGEVVKLNPKKAVIKEGDNIMWRVPYIMLENVIDVEHVDLE
jgi:hypothetical protein